MRHICARALTVVAFAGLLSSPATTASATPDHVDSTVLPSHARYRGLTYGEWAAVWWQTVLATAIEAGNHHPLIDGGAFGGNNRTVFRGLRWCRRDLPGSPSLSRSRAGRTCSSRSSLSNARWQKRLPSTVRTRPSSARARTIFSTWCRIPTQRSTARRWRIRVVPGGVTAVRYGPLTAKNILGLRQERSPTRSPPDTSCCFRRSASGCTGSSSARTCPRSIWPPTRSSSST